MLFTLDSLIKFIKATSRFAFYLITPIRSSLFDLAQKYFTLPHKAFILIEFQEILSSILTLINKLI